MARGSHNDVDHVWGVDMLTKNEQYGQFCCLKEALTVVVGSDGMLYNRHAPYSCKYMQIAL